MPVKWSGRKKGGKYHLHSLDDGGLVSDIRIIIISYHYKHGHKIASERRKGGNVPDFDNMSIQGRP